MACKTLKLSDVSWPLIQPRFERALHRRVVGRKEIAVFELAEVVGQHPKTVEGWLYAGTEPKATAMFKLVRYFGSDFEQEVFGDIDAGDARPAVNLSAEDIQILRDAASVISARIHGALGGGQVVRLTSKGSAAQ